MATFLQEKGHFSLWHVQIDFYFDIIREFVSLWRSYQYVHCIKPALTWYSLLWNFAVTH